MICPGGFVSYGVQDALFGGNAFVSKELFPDGDLVFSDDQFVVDEDFELPDFSGDEFRTKPELFLNGVSETRCSGGVTSADTVVDGDLHNALSFVKTLAIRADEVKTGN